MASTLIGPKADPGSLFNFSGAVGQTLHFGVVGTTVGGVWGDGTYTSDSVLAAAAVHAGLLEPGQSGVVTVEMVSGLPAYEGAARHGVTSLAYGAWAVAYRLTGVEFAAEAVSLAAPGKLAN